MEKKETTPDKGILEYAAEVDEKYSSLQEGIEEIIIETNELESDMVKYTEEIQNLENKPGSDVRKRANTIARDVANVFNSYSNNVGERTEQIEEDLNFILDGQEKTIEILDPSDPEQRETLEEQRHDLREFTNESKTAIRGISELEQEASNIPDLSRELTKATKELTSTLSTLISVLEEGSAKAERFVTLIDQKLDG